VKTIIFLLISSISFAQSIQKTINLLPDTGQTGSYTSTFGEDNDYNINVPSYTNNGNSTITDNITGLMWQQADGGEMTIENAIIYADNLVLGGFSDWRLPTPIESFSILNHQNNNPAMSNIFTASAAEYWWTNKFQVGDATKVWSTNAGGGIGNHSKSETISAGGIKKFHAKAVRDVTTPTTISNHFTDNGNGTITDNLTQLVWQKVSNPNLFTWENALVYAEGLNLATASDWRLPNIKELQSLNDETVSNPSVNTTFFPTIGAHNYWSSTSLPNQTTKAWYWSTIFGVTTYDTKTNTNFVICVRGTPAVLAINEIDFKSKIKVFPNPFSSYITIKNGNGNETFILYNQLGQEVFSGKNIEQKDFTYLQSGVYYLLVKDSYLKTFKVIKE
jgi:hypothetical protein